MKVQAAPPQNWQWLVDRVGCAITPSFRAIEAVDVYAKVHGMVGYDRWTDNSCEMHVAVDSPMVIRHLLYPAFEYPFLQCGKGVVIGLVRSDNYKAIKLDKHLGFTELQRIKDGHSKGVDLIIFEMRKEIWLARQKRKAA